MQAVILAGGKGRRLLPYTNVLPKPLMPVGDFPILEILIRQLAFHGFKDIILAVGYLNHLIEAYFQDGSKFGVEISYSLEQGALGTAGPLGLMSDQLDDDFLVLNGDLLTTFDFKKILNFHKNRNADATIGTFPRNQKVDFGVIETDEEGRLQNYIEKPTYDFDVSMGVNVLSKKSILEEITPDQYLDIPDLMRKLKDKRGQVFCFKDNDCQWLDIGRVDDYQRAHSLFDQFRSQFLPDQ